MAQIIPTTKELAASNLSVIEGKVHQTAPIQDKSYNRTVAGMEALQQRSLYLYGVDRALQNLAVTATDLESLKLIGSEVGVFYNIAEAAVLKISLPAVDGTFIPATANFIGQLNDIVYRPDAGVTATGGEAILTVTATEVGVIGNLSVGSILDIDKPIVGAETEADVIEIINLGADDEGLEQYRARVLSKLRADPGGGNAYDYKSWAEEVAGVKQVYVYAGKPFDSLETSYPGDRTIYVEAVESIDPDGIAPQGLLDEVRTAVNTNPETSQSRPPLGLVDSTLYIESITRTTFYVTIGNLDVSTVLEEQVKDTIKDSLESYFLSLRPFVESIDFSADRNDTITNVSIAEIVQRILRANEATAEEVLFGEVVGSYLTIRTLSPNELAKLGDVVYIG